MVIVLLDTFATEIIQQLTEPNRITMNAILTFSRRSLLLVALFLMGCLQLLAQTRTIKGEVTDAQNGEALIGATVMVDGEKGGTVTVDINTMTWKYE